MSDPSSIWFSRTIARTGIVAWLIGMFVLGMTYGSVLGDLEAFITDIEQRSNFSKLAVVLL